MGIGATIIADAHVITCDGYNRGGRLSLLIRAGRIAEITANSENLRGMHPHATVFDASDMLVVPGFVNAHFHSESVLLRARTDGLHYGTWKRDHILRKAMQALADPGGADDLRTLYLTSYFSHLKSGTTAVGEFPPPVEAKGLVRILQAIDRADVRATVVLQNWDQIRQAKELGSSESRFMIGLCREEEFTVYTFENLLRASLEYGFPLCAHLAEQREDVEVVRKNFQKSPLALLRDYRMLTEQTLEVHLNHIPVEDIGVLEEAGSRVVIAPRATALKQTGFPVLRNMLTQVDRLCLGTDWGSTDILEEMRFLYELPLLIPAMPQLRPLEIVKMGTVNGARALGMDSGVIEVGKRADLTLFSLLDLRLPPIPSTAEGLAALLLRHLTTRDISHVMVGGEFYLAKGAIMTLDEGDIRSGFSELSHRYFPQSAGPESRPFEQSQTTKIIPLIPEPRKGSEILEGFEEGFVITGKLESRAETSKARPEPLVVPADRMKNLPELSKDVKKEFGDDDF